jgi:hypothetical protein
MSYGISTGQALSFEPKALIAVIEELVGRFG